MFASKALAGERVGLEPLSERFWTVWFGPRGLPDFVRAAPGYRGAQELPDLVAPVLGPDGKVLVDEQGKPRQCRFRVVEASLKPDGFLMIYLTAADREYHAQGDHCYSASLSIQADYVRLVLPETPIDDRGRVTFTGQLPVAVAVDPLPLSAVDVTVRRGSPMASRGAVQ